MASTQRILIVDDDTTILESFSKILALGGYSVATVSSGKEALAAIQAGPFDLVILDLSMPEPDGFDVLRFTHSKMPALKLLAISRAMHGVVLDAAKALGATATLDKLLAPDLLLTIVSQLLEESIDDPALPSPSDCVPSPYSV